MELFSLSAVFSVGEKSISAIINMIYSCRVGFGMIHMESERNENKAHLQDKENAIEIFAKANRYLLEKETYSEKDYDYAFSKLPAMEKGVKQDERM